MVTETGQPDLQDTNPGPPSKEVTTNLNQEPETDRIRKSETEQSTAQGGGLERGGLRPF